MLLLHLSDIHFREPHCNLPRLDPDRPVRTRLVHDARSRLDELGPLDAVLITGDVAFKGDPAEYAAALDWLTELSEQLECPMERIFVAPGNHDVDRRIIQRSLSTRNAQEAIAQAPAERREAAFRAQISDGDTGRALLAPLAAYNDFAKHFDCQVFLPERLYWTQQLKLTESVTLQIHGLTPTLLSGKGGLDDDRESLYLSPLQTVLDPLPDVVNLVMCHHPPDWFLDQDDVHDAVCERAHVQLFGHKHRQRVYRDSRYIRFDAGAVNPDRNERGWHPGYNLVSLRVAGSGPARVLRIEAHLLEWQSSPERYRPVLSPDGDPVVRHEVQLPSRRTRKVRYDVSPSFAQNSVSEIDVSEPGQTEAPTLAGSSDQSVGRNIIGRFWALRRSERRQIANEFHLLEEEDDGLNEAEKYGRAFLRATERGQAEELATAISNFVSANGVP